MNKLSVLTGVLLTSTTLFAQRAPEKVVEKSLIASKLNAMGKEIMTPEKLWTLGRVSAEGISRDGKTLLFGVSNYNIQDNTSEKNLFHIPVAGGQAKPFTKDKGGESVVQITDKDEVIYTYEGQLWKKPINGQESIQLTDFEGGLENVKFSPNGKHILFSRAVVIKKYHSADKYEDLAKSDVYIYDDLDYRHWDTFNKGEFNHLFLASFEDGEIGEAKDLLEGEPYYTPQAPFGGTEDYTWAPDSRSVLYVSKKKFGKEYAQSTNTDIYRYDILSQNTTNITVGMNGYDTNPAYSPDGTKLAWLSMKTEGYEADKNDIILLDKKATQRVNLTKTWDGTVEAFYWSKNGRKLYFTAPTKGTVQLFQIDATIRGAKVRQMSEGDFDITGIVGEVDGGLIVTSTTMTRATEVYSFNFKRKTLVPVTHVNDHIFNKLAPTKVEGRFTKASDGEDLFSWVIYPPDFDKNKKYPTLLFCQGGPQAATTQGYSYRWNFQLMASQGYIVIMPNRRGMPGWGVKWNEDISGDWGGQAIQDYLSAIDDLSKEPYIDSDRIGAVGASYGGYSVFMLAGVHQGRFKTLISHCGLFDMTAWYGTTEELFFANHDLGGPYWDSNNSKNYTDFNPIKYVDKWDTPILIFQGGKDFRVPVGQGLSAFQAAQLKNIKSRLVYLPEENHWVLSGHNAQVWQREFFGWLKETL
ncbi:S9 family peptidase [Sphingobacterium sp. JB170]|uniref:S9 family peptidase n=1 Tax=Sphingobacterium sp. JB170 TaxID=1434842 RepID=UPI00097ED64D|nr:S9 family peptidase [Sphingobacterium sp. JB170]SJN40457.1 peptidase S9, prolyl oligopeptidase active site domain protein [Sphingobacterium sp. JB170]